MAVFMRALPNKPTIWTMNTTSSMKQMISWRVLWSKTVKSTEIFGTPITKNLGFHCVVQKVASQILAIKRGKLLRIT
jgi:hypothetical protein